MNSLHFRDYGLWIGTAALLAACGGSQPQAAMLPSATATSPIHRHYTRSWMLSTKISGSTGTVQSSTALNGTFAVFQYWIAGTKVVAANISSFHTPNGDVRLFKYPTGGTASKIIGGFSKPIGVTVSLGR